MQYPPSSPLPLRTGRYSLEDAGGPGAVVCLSLHSHSGEPPLAGLDAVLATAASADGNLARRVLEIIQEQLEQEPAGSDPETLLRRLAALSQETPGADAAEHVDLALNLVLVRGEDYWATGHGGSTAYLARNGSLQALEAASPAHSLFETDDEPAGADTSDYAPVPVLFGRLKDGDALLLASADLLDATTEAQVWKTLANGFSPGAAAVHLAEEARRAGGPPLGVALLYVGRGPVPIGRPLPPPDPVSTLSAAVTLATRSSRRRDRIRMTVLAATLAGCLGLAGGIGVAMLLGRSPVHGDNRVASAVPAASNAPQTSSMGVAGPGSASTEPAGGAAVTVTPVSGQPSRTVVPAVSSTSAAGMIPAAAPAAAVEGSGAAETSHAARPATVDAAPAVLPSIPSPRAQGAGLPPRIRLAAALDATRSEMQLVADQGVLYTTAFPQGVPAGQPLSIPFVSMNRLVEGTCELRFVAPSGQVAMTIRPQDFALMLRGEVGSLPALPPADYRLAWWSAGDTTQSPPFLVLRLAAP